jgi:uncharacterized protein YecE (DUF72 family)
MTSTSTANLRAQAERFDFRTVTPHVRFGTASDRYAAWIGQVYPEHYRDQISSRTRKLGGQTFEERNVPIASVAEYFEHFGTLELDFTFYRPLRDEDGEPTNNFFVLQKYADHAPDHASFLLKAPQQYFARTLRRSRDGKTHYIDNPDFLDADAYRTRFHEPALEILGDRIDGLLFQQEYQRVGDSPSPEENVDTLDGFFHPLPDTPQPHIELRSEHLLTDVYFDWLAERGLGFIFSHWTWLPPIRKQWTMCGERFTARDGSVVARLLTPRDVKYAQAYANAYPFDKRAPEIADTQQAQDMVLDATALVFQAEAQNALLHLIANNRAWGNAPDLARTIAQRVLDVKERREGGS